MTPMRSRVGPSLWWQLGQQPKVGDEFSERNGVRHEITSVVASDGGWLYETTCDALVIAPVDVEAQR